MYNERESRVHKLLQKKINWDTKNLVKYMFKKEQFTWNNNLLMKKFVQDRKFFC